MAKVAPIEVQNEMMALDREDRAIGDALTKRLRKHQRNRLIEKRCGVRARIDALWSTAEDWPDCPGNSIAIFSADGTRVERVISF